MENHFLSLSKKISRSYSHLHSNQHSIFRTNSNFHPHNPISNPRLSTPLPFPSLSSLTTTQTTVVPTSLLLVSVAAPLLVAVGLPGRVPFGPPGNVPLGGAPPGPPPPPPPATGTPPSEVNAAAAWMDPARVGSIPNAIQPKRPSERVEPRREYSTTGSPRAASWTSGKRVLVGGL